MASTQALGLSFDHLPLVEVAVRASFQTPVSITYKTIDFVHDRLKPQFARKAEPTQLEIAPGIGPSPAEFGPNQLPGVVYADDQRGVRVSVHPQVIVARWVKPFAADAPRYPRFDALRDALWTTAEALRTAIPDEFSAVLVANMSYVNFIEGPDPATVLTEYFSPEAQIGIARDARQIRKFESSWLTHDAVDLRFALEQVTATFGVDRKDGYRLTTAAGTRLSEAVDAKSGLERVHQRLQEFFVELISLRAKTEWGMDTANA